MCTPFTDIVLHDVLCYCTRDLRQTSCALCHQECKPETSPAGREDAHSPDPEVQARAALKALKAHSAKLQKLQKRTPEKH